MQNLQALIVGENVELMIAVPTLLSRAGFAVDVISNSYIFKKHPAIRNFEFVANSEDMAKVASEKNKNNYSLIVIGDDHTLKRILNSDLSVEEIIALLPIQSIKNLDHIYSKIGLSRVLREFGINTPEFRIINDKSELKQSVKSLGYPVFVKVDSSGGGFGVFECSNNGDIEILLKKLQIYPVLLQKKIQGVELDLSGFYQNCKLIHFSYSRIERVNGKFGASVLRTYVQIAHLQKNIFDELESLGKALGANGFVNIACIQSDHDKKIYFIEADMRPTAWVDFSKFIGDDPAIQIKKFFSNGNTLQHPYPVNFAYPDQIPLPYFSRIKLWELAINRYSVWRYLPNKDHRAITLYLIIRKIKTTAIQKLKPLMPEKYWVKLKFAYQKSRNSILHILVK
ncbi:ATP-grasp domain-containing protein [Candidatus Nitrotoga sp. M5]|uniref:ATP-grasp domain-containing protein n=1 Tax=Candidatus Nitrotoga sp. M5 TaxID=2890409 RepID=UPI001EF344FC|nr:ATP-grasp domain-containing protein [Candidatus Nitrotoga sp. M5]CAH1386375.1 ATP-grasp domain-containing protein [Candidatus Nitrotoga sp. M5]